MPVSRREARELMSLGYELGATVLSGALQRRADGTWWIEDRALEDVLADCRRHRTRHLTRWLRIDSCLPSGRRMQRLQRNVGWF